jgi:hypothetical protein
MSSQEPVEVYAARDEIDATLVNSMLAEAGIKSRVVGGQIAGAVGELPAGLPSAPRVWAPADRADEARQLIREMEQVRRQHQDNGDVWNCTGCNEDVTVDFEICWNCQTPREASAP